MQACRLGGPGRRAERYKSPSRSPYKPNALALREEEDPERCGTGYRAGDGSCGCVDNETDVSHPIDDCSGWLTEATLILFPIALVSCE